MTIDIHKLFEDVYEAKKELTKALGLEGEWRLPEDKTDEYWYVTEYKGVPTEVAYQEEPLTQEQVDNDDWMYAHSVHNFWKIPGYTILEMDYSMGGDLVLGVFDDSKRFTPETK